MNKEPFYRKVRAHDGTWHGYFAIRLQRIGVAPHGWGDENAFVRLQLSQQAAMISTFSSMGGQTALEIRFIRHAIRDKGALQSVNVVLRARCTASEEESAAEKIRVTFANVWPSLVSVSEHYHWSFITSEADYALCFESEQYRHHAEIARREVVLRLDLDSVPIRQVGFAPPDIQRRLQDPSDLNVCFIAPFRASGSTWEYLFRVLLMHPNECALSISIQPTRIVADESAFLLSQILQCERYLQLPNEGRVSVPQGFSPPLKTNAGLVLTVLDRMLFTLTDDVFAVRIQLSSNERIGTGLIDAVGGAVTHTPAAPTGAGASELGDAALSGGYDWYSPASPEELLTAQRNLQEIGFEQWCPSLLPANATRLRQLLGAHESVSAFRLPLPITGKFPGLDTMLSRYIVADTDLPSGGLLLGVNERLGVKSEVRLTDDDRRRHCYIVGQTGTGKTTLLLNLILQDIQSGRGVCVFDPHGDLIARVLRAMPEARQDDVVHFDPADPACSIGINLFDCADEGDRDRAINHLFEMFQAFYDMREAGGPQFELYFRRCVALLTMDPKQPGTLCDFQRIFSDDDFREARIAECKNEEVKAFWNLADKRTGDWTLENISYYVTSKLTRFVDDVFIRRFISQPKSSVDLLGLMAQQKILLLNLHKGLLGNMNCSMLGAFWISLLERATFRRLMAQTDESQPDFNLYVDEFQQFAFESFISLLAEARKFGLNITIANQYFDQVPEKVLDSVLGNVGTLIAFRLGQKDAERIKDLFVPTVQPQDLMLLPNHRAYIKTLIHGQAQLPFSLETWAPIAHAENDVG